MLTLVEELLLVAIDDETGKMNMSVSSSIHYGLAGAILMELTLHGCLDYKDKKIIFLDKTDTENELLNESLQYLREKNKGKDRSVKYWVQKLGTHISWKKKHLSYINHLIEKGILKQDETKYFFFFTKDVYPSANTGKENLIRERVKTAVLFEDVEIDDRTVCLIGILKACNMDRQIFTKEEYKIAKKKIATIMKSNPHGKAVYDTIQAMQAAIFASIVAGAAATSNSNSS